MREVCGETWRKGAGDPTSIGSRGSAANKKTARESWLTKKRLFRKAQSLEPREDSRVRVTNPFVPRRQGDANGKEGRRIGKCDLAACSGTRMKKWKRGGEAKGELLTEFCGQGGY